MLMQLGFADFKQRKSLHETSKEKFLGRMTHLVPWVMLEALIEPYYPKRGNGRPPYPLSTMLRIHCLQQWYNLSDLVAEEALYKTSSISRFARLSLEHALSNMVRFTQLIKN